MKQYEPGYPEYIAFMCLVMAWVSFIEAYPWWRFMK